MRTKRLPFPPARFLPCGAGGNLAGIVLIESWTKKDGYESRQALRFILRPA